MTAIEIQELLRAGDSFAAIEHIQRQGDSLEIAARYQSLLSELYWKAHDLPAVLVVGHAGILHCLGQSLIAGTSAENIEKLRSIAKALAYDIGSFTWAGWEEPGIDPTPDQLAVGLDCAELNLRLAIELRKPSNRLAMAHWLVGAHALAARDADMAITHFQLARAVLPVKDDASKTLDLCNGGYLALARLCKNATDASLQANFNEIIAQLNALPDKEVSFYVSQLMTARRLFCMPHSP
jgi:hypothetical protein